MPEGLFKFILVLLQIVKVMSVTRIRLSSAMIYYRIKIINKYMEYLINTPQGLCALRAHIQIKYHL